MVFASQEDVETVKASHLFNEKWYVDQYPDTEQLAITPAEHFLWIGWRLGRNPSEEFSTSDYLKANPDVAAAGVNPLIHYLNWGKSERRHIGGSTELHSVADVQRRIVVFASFSSKGIVEAYVRHYLRALSKVSDAIIFVCDNELDQESQAYLDSICYHTIKGRHEEYDFGSYKRGISYARSVGLLEYAEELLLCNDSCYGPVSDLSDLFREMDRRDVDFWGITYNTEFRTHIQSYFVNFRKAVFNKPTFDAFFCSVEKKADVSKVIMSYEVPMTSYFEVQGFTWDTILSRHDHSVREKSKAKSNLTLWPMFMIDKGSPFVKVKALKRVFCNYEGMNKTYDEIRLRAPELAFAVEQHIDLLVIRSSNDISFSLVMPFYNRIKTLPRAVDSVLAQTHQNFELVLIDDGSSDGSSSLLKERYAKQINDGRIVLIELPGRHGVSKARNVGLDKTKHPWIGYVDSDNTISHTFLETFASLITEHPSHRIFYCWHQSATTGEVHGAHFQRWQLLEGNFIDLGAVIHSRKLYIDNGGFDTNLKRLVDWDLLIRYTHVNHPVCIPSPMVYYWDDVNDRSRISVSESLDSARIAIRQKYKMWFRVTTIIPTYNHRDFIRAAVESAINQTGNIEHRILICDDGSTDGTRDIVAQLARDHPKIVRDISRDGNHGISDTFRYCIERAHGDFIAILEGDDVWTDPEKLHKQVQFLVDNPSCSMVFSKISVKSLPAGTERTLERQNDLTKRMLSGSDFLADPSMNLIANFSSCLFKGGLLRSLPARLFNGRINEIALAFHMERQGPIGFIDEVMSVYHQHANGVWTGSSKRDQLISGLATRQMAIDVADPKYADAIWEVVRTKYREPLASLGSS